MRYWLDKRVAGQVGLACGIVLGVTDCILAPLPIPRCAGPAKEQNHWTPHGDDFADIYREP